MKIYVFCVAVRNRKGGELCVWVRGPGSRADAPRCWGRGRGVDHIERRLRATVHRRSPLPLSLRQGVPAPRRKWGGPWG